MEHTVKKVTPGVRRDWGRASRFQGAISPIIAQPPGVWTEGKAGSRPGPSDAAAEPLGSGDLFGVTKGFQLGRIGLGHLKFQALGQLLAIWLKGTTPLFRAGVLGRW